MLRVDPKMLARLSELEVDLVARRERAQTERWLGEIEGIDLTLAYLAEKREQAERLRRTTPINLGMLTRRAPGRDAFTNAAASLPGPSV